MKKILFPTEFSDHAGQMFRYALELANRFNATLICMHAYGRPEGYSLTDEEGKRKKVLEKLETFAKSNTPAPFSNVIIQYVAELDYPADAILSAAKKENADLIVLGMTGKTDDATRHLGSNAMKVIRAAECPVLAIPASASYEEVKKVVVTTEFDFEDLGVLNFLNEGFDAEVQVIPVVEKTIELGKAREKMSSLEKAYAQRERMSFQVLEGADIEKTIEQYVNAENADLLAMTAHKRSVIVQLLSGSTARNIARKTKTPLLIFKID